MHYVCTVYVLSLFSAPFISRCPWHISALRRSPSPALNRVPTIVNKDRVVPDLSPPPTSQFQASVQATIKYYHSENHYFTSACLQKLAADGSMVFKSDSALEDSSIDAFFVSMYNWKDDPWGVPWVKSPNRPNISFVPLGESEESSPLASSEWVEFVSIFFNREAVARDLTKEIGRRWQCHADKVSAKSGILFFK